MVRYGGSEAILPGRGCSGLAENDGIPRLRAAIADSGGSRCFRGGIARTGGAQDEGFIGNTGGVVYGSSVGIIVYGVGFGLARAIPVATSKLRERMLRACASWGVNLVSVPGFLDPFRLLR